MKTRLFFLVSLGAIFFIEGANTQPATDTDQTCATWPKGTTQTPAGMCIDGVLFKDVLARLAALESRIELSDKPSRSASTLKSRYALGLALLLTALPFAAGICQVN